MERYHSLTHKFIVIDGVDYSGKTSLTKLLENYDFTALKSPSNDTQGYDVIKRVFKEYCLKEESLKLFTENNKHLSDILCEQYSHKSINRIYC
jgi:thymidylate kinase